jgi:ATP-binding cassette, subfamily B, bacterial MsbA
VRESLPVTADPGSVVTRLRRLLPYFGQLKGTWAIVALGALIGAATEPMIPALLKPLLDRGFQQGTLEIWTVPVALLALFGVRGLSGYVSQIGLTKISNHSLQILRRAMFEKIMHADLKLFKDQTSSALSNTLVYEVQTGSAMLVAAFLGLTRNSLTVLALTGYLFFLNWQLTLIVAAVFPAIAMVMKLLMRRLHHITKANLDATDKLAYVVEENVLAHRDIRLHNAQSSQAHRFDQLSESLRHLAMKSTVAGAAMTPITQMLAVISIALVQSADGASSVGAFVSFVTAMLMIIGPIRQLSEVSSPITRGLAALERGLDLIQSAPDEVGGDFSKTRASGDIEFAQVSVIFSPDSPPALNALSLKVGAGETVALVGASGSGKTTLVNLLPRFANCQSGCVSLDGHDIRQWNIQSLRAQFALVSQHVVMLNDSVANNVALGLPLDRNRVLDCLAAAHLKQLIEELPGGIDTVVGHNAMQLSGGQRQRLAIARALYKDAPILILDEATSALDTESEIAVQEALQSLMQNRTTLVIAHRLSTVRNADRIVVIDAGSIVEVGTHAQLVEKDGTYARLYKMGLHAPALPPSGEQPAN